MTAFGFRLRSADEAQAAIRAGADVLDLGDGATAGPGSPFEVRVLTAVAESSADDLSGADDPPDQSRPIRGGGQRPPDGRSDDRSAESRRFAVLNPQAASDERVSEIAAAGIHGVLLDSGEGQHLFAASTFPEIGAAVEAVRRAGMKVAIAGALEAPDVPRLLPVRPDVLIFGRSIRRAGTASAEFDLERIAGIRGALRQDEAVPDTEVRNQSSVSGADLPLDRIFLTEYVVPVRIGAYDQERLAPQQVRFDIEVSVAPVTSYSGMAGIYSYDRISDAIDAIAVGPHIDFVETLAERLATAILSDPRAKQVEIRIEKLELGRRTGIVITRRAG